jgi:hypothetical protein
MCTRIFSQFLGLSIAVLALSGCGLTEDRNTSTLNDSAGPAGTENNALAAAEKSVDAEVVNDGKLACAVGGATAFSRVCELEQAQTDKGLILTLRHPDGGFRKLQVVTDGRGVIPADGADPATVRLTGAKEIEVTVAGNRYLLPATVKPPAAAAATKPAVPATKG